MKSDRVSLIDMLQAAERIRSYIAGMSETAFVQDDRTVDAAAFELMALGEASKTLSQRTQRTISGVPWTDLRLVRNTVAHEHNTLNRRTLWRTLTRDVPPIEAALRAALR